MKKNFLKAKCLHMSVIISYRLKGDWFKAFCNRLPNGSLESFGWLTALPVCLSLAGIPHNSDRTGSQHSEMFGYQGYTQLYLDGLLHISIEYCSLLFKNNSRVSFLVEGEKKELLRQAGFSTFFFLIHHISYEDYHVILAGLRCQQAQNRPAQHGPLEAHV